MGNFVEFMFGKAQTPTEIMAEIAAGALRAERILTREAKKAEMQCQKAFVEAQNLRDDAGWDPAAIEGRLRSRYLIAEQSQDRADRFHAQAGALRDFATTTKLMSSNLDMLKAQLRSSALMGRLLRLLPNNQELMQLAKRLELSKFQQEQIRETLGDGMKEFSEGLYSDAAGELGTVRDSPQERVNKRMALFRIEAGLEAEDADELLARAPKVIGTARRSAPVMVSSSSPGPPASGDNSDDDNATLM